MDKYQQLIGIIAKQTGTAFGPASASSLSSLRALGVPDTILRFYELHEPADCAEGQVRLWPVSHIVTENRMAVPGIVVHPLGYVVFASTMSGDAYCFNVNKLDREGEPEIVLISHGTFGEDATAEQVQRVVKPVAPSLFLFLEQFSKGEVDEDCLY
jgi:hypothetical protein